MVFRSRSVSPAADVRVAGELLSRPALGTLVALVVAEPGGLDAAAEVLDAEVAAFELACGRSQSELARIDAATGPRTCRVGPVLADVLTAAMGAATRTAGLLDPTWRESGDGTGWTSVGWTPATRELRLPAGLHLDLDAPARALAADRIATRVAERAGCGAMVTVGRAVAASGAGEPRKGWLVGIADEPADMPLGISAAVTLRSGGLVTARSGARRVPKAAGAGAWRAVTVLASSCAVADEESRTAVRGDATAPALLDARGLPARFLGVDGSVVLVGGWESGASGRVPAPRRPAHGPGGHDAGRGPRWRRPDRAGGAA